MTGRDYNYTEVVNNAIFYGICYWLNIPHEQSVKLASSFLTSDLKLEGLKDEERDRIMHSFSQIALSLGSDLKLNSKGNSL